MTSAATQAKPLTYKNPYLTITTVGFLSFESQKATLWAAFAPLSETTEAFVKFRENPCIGAPAG
jgi:hypothetical protein